ncbi:MAG TPA: cbb3-type cytochrome oxidase assembly protein CcoS [Burkholderiales bacterium]|jgi:cbb3-type cytochrome oxidase maturation protein
MTSLLLLIPLSVLVLVGAGAALFWAIDRGQFDDLETPALLPLIDADASASSAVAPDEDSS